MTENVTALKSFAEYVAPGELGSLDDLERGQGAIVRRWLEKIAAYRDHSGALHLNFASCTHVGCLLHRVLNRAGLPMSWLDVRCLPATDQRSGHRAAGQGWRDPVVTFLPLRLGRSYKLVPETDGSPLFLLLPFSRLVIALAVFALPIS